MGTAAFLKYEPQRDKYPRFDFIDGDVFKIIIKDNSPDGGISLRKNAILFGRPIYPDFVPSVALWKERYEPSDLLQVHGCPCVSDLLKDMIESIEPKVHQFFPLKIVRKSGENASNHWIWVVCNRIDSVDRTLSRMVMKNRIWVSDGIDDPKLVFNLAQIGNRDFWRDSRISGGRLLVSPKAYDLLNAAQPTGVRFRTVEAI